MTLQSPCDLTFNLNGWSDPASASVPELLESAVDDLQSERWDTVWAKATRGLSIERSLVGHLYAARAAVGLGELRRATEQTLLALELDASRPSLWQFLREIALASQVPTEEIASIDRAIRAASATDQDLIQYKEGLSTSAIKQYPRQRAANFPKASQDIVDIIIPIYNGYAHAKACVQALLEHTDPKHYELILVDDASTDPRMSIWLDELVAWAKCTDSSKPKITRLYQALNQGFVRTCNLGLALHPNREAVLLNTDTIVPADWLPRLQAVAQSAPDIGTVTPMSNNAEHLSYPRSRQAMPIPEPDVIKTINDFLRTQRTSSVDIPIGVGFCMLITAKCRELLPLMSEEVTVRGYGEDTDYCLQVQSYGLRNVCATNLFVPHHGTVSFGHEKKVLAQHNLKLLRQRYPNLSKAFRPFIETNQLKSVRYALDRHRFIERASEMVCPRYLWILGVTPIHASSEQRYQLHCERLGVSLWTLTRSTQSKSLVYQLKRAGHDEPANLIYELPHDADRLTHDLTQLGFDCIVCQGTVDAVAVDPVLARLVTAPYRVVVYCTEKTITHHQPTRGLGLTLWVSNPSSERLATELLDQADIQHAPWYEHLALISAPKAAQPANQCYAVFIHPHDVRGFVRLLGFARFLAANHQGSRLIVLGTTPDDIALMRTGCVWVTGMLEEADVKFSARLFRCALSVVIEDQIDPEQVALHHSQLTRLNTKVFQRQSTDRGANDPHYLDIEAPYQRWVSHLQGEPYAA